MARFADPSATHFFGERIVSTSLPSERIHPAQTIDAPEVDIVRVHLTAMLDGVRRELHVCGEVRGGPELFEQLEGGVEVARRQ